MPCATTSLQPDKGRWYLDASWKCPETKSPTIGQLRGHRVLGVDLNAGHLAAVVVDPSGNRVGPPVTVPIELAGLPATTRDGHLRAAISSLIALAKEHRCQAIVIGNLDCKDAREMGRERGGHRPSRGRRGRHFRRMVSGIPTAKFRDRLVQMASNAGLWSSPSTRPTPVNGEPSTGSVPSTRSRQRRRCDSTPAEHGEGRAATPVVRFTAAGPAVLSGRRVKNTGARKARGQPHERLQIRTGERIPPVGRVAQDRSGPSTRQDLVPPSV